MSNIQLIIIFSIAMSLVLVWWIPVYLGVLTINTTWSQLFSIKYWKDQIKSERLRRQKHK